MSDGHAPFEVDRLLRALGPRRDEFPVHFRAETGSTNDDLRALAASGAPSGTVVVADAQSAGRGRRGRTWSSPAGLGLYLSVLLRPDRPPAELPRWTLAGAVAAHEACATLADAPVRIKWPNDLLCGGRKLGGILAEGRAGRDRLEIVLGIGINVHHRPSDFPDALRPLATSLAIEAGSSAPAREHLAAALLLGLESLHRRLECGEWNPIRVRWERAAAPIAGRLVEIESASGVRFRGRVRGIGENGSLEVDREDGVLAAVLVPDSVRWLEE